MLKPHLLGTALEASHLPAAAAEDKPSKARLASNPPPAQLPPWCLLPGDCLTSCLSGRWSERGKKRPDGPEAGMGPGGAGSGGGTGLGNRGQADVTVLTTDLLVTRALVHQEKRLELMCFAPLTRNILTLWASSGQLMALGLENKDATRKPRCRPVCGRLCPLLSRQAPFVHGAFLVRPADSALATGLCPQLTVLRPPSPHPARLLGGLTSGASGSLPTPEAPQVPTQAQLIPPLFSETPAGLGGR